MIAKTQKVSKNQAYADEIDRRLTALSAQGRGPADVAKAIGSSANELYQWRKGIRPVPIESAEPLAAEIGTTPERVSARYAGYPSNDRPALAEPDELEAIRFAISLLSSVMAVHRPIEAKDAAKAIRTAPNIPARYLRKGSFLHELVQTLDGVEAE